MKSPYEIRSELLHLATSHATDQYHTNMDFARSIFQKTLDNMKPTEFATVEDAVAFQKKTLGELQKLMPTFPTPDQIIAQAQTLYGFVQKKD